MEALHFEFLAVVFDALLTFLVHPVDSTGFYVMGQKKIGLVGGSNMERFCDTPPTLPSCINITYDNFKVLIIVHSLLFLHICDFWLVRTPVSVEICSSQTK